MEETMELLAWLDMAARRLKLQTTSEASVLAYGYDRV
jgi:hypothetical protein